MDYSELLRHVDHTLLTPTATWDQVKTVCDEGLTCRTASVCIPPRYVKRAAAYVGNQLKICTVVGFPNGYSTPEVKVFETEDAIRGGADEIDMVADLGLVKSGDWEGVLEEIAPLAAGKLFLSVAAGKELAWLSARLGHGGIVRAMPNINAAVGASVTGWCAGEQVTEEQKALAARLLGTFGTAVEVPEKFMGIVGAIGGAAPAYTYLYINALAEAAVQAGMPKGMAVEIAAAMAEGSGRMVRLSGQHPWALIDRVTSPGGTTVEGLLALQQGGFEPAVHGAVQAVLDKDKRM